MEFSGIIGALEKRPKNRYGTKRSHLEANNRYAPGGVFWVGVKYRGSDTSTTAAVFLLAIV